MWEIILVFFADIFKDVIKEMLLTDAKTTQTTNQCTDIVLPSTPVDELFKLYNRS